jgi:hypothetical protein
MSLMLHRAGLLKPSLAAPPPSVPDAFNPGDWSLAPGDEEAPVTIHALPNDGDAAISDIEYRLDGGSWASSGSTSSFTIEGLTNDQAYDVELRAVNSVGSSPASDTKSVTPAAGGAWEPTDISSAIWLDASDASTLLQERTGGAATTSAGIGDPVGSWFNKGSAGGWATAPADSDRPILRQTGGDKYYLEFDGAGDTLLLDWSTTSANLWAAAAFNMSSSTAGFSRVFSLSQLTPLVQPDFNNANGVVPLYRDGSANVIATLYDSTKRNSKNISMNTDYVVDVQFSSTGSAMSLNGDAPQSSSYTFGPNADRFHVGSHRDAEAYFNGRLYQVVLGTAALGSGDAIDLRAFLADKSAVTL